jgi:3-oxoacyl-[acyl-carrier protein] reductase/2-deoxy-D-gluconate 3-dehydrogenase
MARETIPLGGKMLTPDQIARTAVYLASDESSATTGQVLHVNGGSYMP